MQDRLTKELRLSGITCLEQANAFLPEFILRYNARFAKDPQDPNSAWVPLPGELDTNYYFAVRQSRKVRSDHCISWSGRLLQLLPDPKGPSLVDKSIGVHVVPEGDIYLYHGKDRVSYRPVSAPEAIPLKPTGLPSPQPSPSPRRVASGNRRVASGDKQADPKAAARRRAWLFAPV